MTNPERDCYNALDFDFMQAVNRGLMYKNKRTEAENCELRSNIKEFEKCFTAFHTILIGFEKISKSLLREKMLNNIHVRIADSDFADAELIPNFYATTEQTYKPLGEADGVFSVSRYLFKLLKQYKETVRKLISTRFVNWRYFIDEFGKND